MLKQSIKCSKLIISAFSILNFLKNVISPGQARALLRQKTGQKAFSYQKSQRSCLVQSNRVHCSNKKAQPTWMDIIRHLEILFNEICCWRGQFISVGTWTGNCGFEKAQLFDTQTGRHAGWDSNCEHSSIKSVSTFVIGSSGRLKHLYNIKIQTLIFFWVRQSWE